jgi:hypothetical protein
MLLRASKEHSGSMAVMSGGGSVQRYIEELRDAEERPVYLPGDRICLRLRAAHEVNLGSVWAIFRRLPERRRAPGDPYITLPGRHYTLTRAGAIRTSEVCFEIEFCRDRHLPGEYGLKAVRAYPYELDGREDLIVEFEIRDEIRFRIVEEVGASSPRVTGWTFD